MFTSHENLHKHVISSVVCEDKSNKATDYEFLKITISSIGVVKNNHKFYKEVNQMEQLLYDYNQFMNETFSTLDNPSIV